MFERFTEGARRTIVAAQEEARLLQHPSIGTEHLLLGLLHVSEPTSALLAAAGVDYARVRAAIIERAPIGATASPGAAMPFRSESKRALEVSLRRALELGYDHLDAGHLFLGVIDQPDALAAQTLVGLGVDLDAIRAQMIAAMRAVAEQARTAPRVPRPDFPREPAASATIDRLVAQVDRLEAEVARLAAIVDRLDTGD